MRAIMSIICATITLLFLLERNMATSKGFDADKIERVGRDSPPTEKSPIPNEYSHSELEVFTDRFARRLNLLQSQCTEIQKNGLHSKKSMGKVIPEVNLAFCAAWKCSSTYWGALYKSIINYRNITQWTSAERLATFNDPSSTRVLIVRHPMVRLVSAWNEKMSKHHVNGAHYYRSSLRVGLDKYDTHHWRNDSTKSHYVSFHNFVTWVALDEHKKNRHFQPAINMCPPCQNFNYIVKVETMNDDIFAMFQKQQFEVPPTFDLGTPKRSFDNGIGQKSTSAIVEHIKSMYKGVSKVALTKLKAKYQRDLDLFGYTFDIETSEPGGLEI